MGGGGIHYHRDTTDGYARSAAGVSKAAEQLMSQQSVDPGVLPLNRRLTCKVKNPVVYIFDVTGSMNNLPKIIADKMPMIAGQIVQNGYLTDVELSLAAVGDIKCDHAPVQVGDFAEMKRLDDWLKRLWLEKGGGSDDEESYEFMAYFYARYCDFSNAVTPICLFTADEGIASRLYKTDLERIFGGTHETISTVDVFKELDQKFKGNVFLIHRRYHSDDAKALRGWQKCLGDKRIIRLGTDQSIADLTLGLFALVTGARTLEEYLGDMKTKRARAQTDDRVAEVRKALKPLVAYLESRSGEQQTEPSIEESMAQHETSFPSPDELNHQINAEDMKAIDLYLKQLATLLKGPNRPFPNEFDGWTYCMEPILPIGVINEEDQWDHLRQVLGDAGWDSEIKFSKDCTHIRIRRKK